MNMATEATMARKTTKASAHGGPRPGAGRPATGRSGTAVKLDEEMVRKAKILAAYREETVSGLLSGLLAPLVDRLLAEEQAKATRMGSNP